MKAEYEFGNDQIWMDDRHMDMDVCLYCWYTCAECINGRMNRQMADGVDGRVRGAGQDTYWDW